METPKKHERYLVKVLFVRGATKRSRENKIIIVDNKDGEVGYRVIEDPKITFYVDKKDKDDGITRLYRHIEDVDCIRDVPYRELKDELAYQTQNERALDIALQNGGYAVSDLIKKMSAEPNIHGSDVNIVDHYIGRWCDRYSKEMTYTPKLHKCYLDIEVDNYHCNGMSTPEDPDGIIDLLSLYSDKHNVCYTHIYKTPDNMKQIQAFIDNCDGYKRKFEDRFKFKWIPRFYDREEDLICDLFDTINSKRMRPDFVSMWNAAYDYRMLRARLVEHDINPADVICPEGFPYPYEYYSEDKNQKIYDPSTRGDFIEVSGYTNYICQMLTYASIRANEPNKESYKLNDVLENEIEDKKDEVPVSMRQFSRYDFARYVEYNIQDAHSLHKLESKLQDISLLYTIAMITRSRINKALKKTTSLRNLAADFMLRQGIVISNNHNMSGYGSSEEGGGKFEGAFVLDPTTVDHIGEEILNKKSSRIFRGVGDADMSSMYPRIILYTMADPSNQVGRMLIQNVTGENCTNEMTFDLLRRDYMKFCQKWLGLPDKQQVLKKVLSV